MSVFRWLHFSDLHWGREQHRFHWDGIVDALDKDLSKLYKKTGAGWDAVFFTGDIVNKGKTDEYEAAKQKIDDLMKIIGKHSGKLPNVFYVPGNHDLKRFNEKSEDDKDYGPAFHAIAGSWFEVEYIRNKVLDKADENSYRQFFQWSFSGYTAFFPLEDLPHASLVEGLLPGDFSVSLGNDDLRIGLIGLNSAYLQLKSGNFEGKLDLRQKQLLEVCAGEIGNWFKSHDVNLLMTHHPENWLNYDSNAEEYGEIFMPGRFGIHLYGHAHTQELQNDYYNGSLKSVIQVQAPALFAREEYEWWNKNGKKATQPRIHGYSAGEIKKESGKLQFRLWPRHIPTQNLNLGPGRVQAPRFFQNYAFDYPDEPDDEGTKPIKMTSCRNVAGSAGIGEASKFLPERNNELSALQVLAKKNLSAALEGIYPEFLNDLLSYFSRKFNVQLQNVSDLSDYMVCKDLDQTVAWLELGLSDYLEKISYEKGPESPLQRKIWEHGLKVLGYLIQLSIFPKWYDENKAGSSHADFFIPVQTSFGVEIVVSTLAEFPARLKVKRPIPMDSGCEKFISRDSGPIELGAGLDPDENIVEIKKKLYRRCVEGNPMRDPSNPPDYTRPEDDRELKELIKQQLDRERQIYIPVNTAMKGSPLQDPKVVATLARDLNVPIVQYNTPGDSALMYGELLQIQNWLENFYRHEPR